MEKNAPSRLLPEYSDDDDDNSVIDHKESVRPAQNPPTAQPLAKDRREKTDDVAATVIHARDLRNADWEYDSAGGGALGQRSMQGGFDRVSRTRHQLGYIAQVAKESEQSIAESSRKAAESRKATRMKYGW